MPNKRRRLIGQVIGTDMQKTIMVAVINTKRHPVYGKVLRITKKYMVHDEHGEAQVGDIVRIVESQPISKRKRFALEAIERRVETVTTPVDELAGEVEA